MSFQFLSLVVVVESFDVPYYFGLATLFSPLLALSISISLSLITSSQENVNITLLSVSW